MATYYKDTIRNIRSGTILDGEHVIIRFKSGYFKVITSDEQPIEFVFEGMCAATVRTSGPALEMTGCPRSRCMSGLDAEQHEPTADTLPVAMATLPDADSADSSGAVP